MGDFLCSLDILKNELKDLRVSIDVKNPKVSIIVPVFNAEKYVVSCLMSLVRQSLCDIEIIVIDDGSTDNSYSICAVFAQCDKRIKLYSQENKGRSATRNFGVSVASGEYIGFCDSDDWVDLKYYEKLYSAAKRYNCEMAMSGIMRHKKYKNKQLITIKSEKAYFDINDVMQVTKIPKYSYVWNKIYRRKSLMQLGVEFPVGRNFEDVCWSARVVTQLRGLVTVPNVFYDYRMTEGSIVSQQTAKRYKEEFVAIEDVLGYLEENNIPIFCKVALSKKIYIKIFGIKFLTIERFYPNNYLFKLFGFIKFLTYE